MRTSRLLAAFAVFVAARTTAHALPIPPSEAVAPNDNRHPAGTSSAGVLTVHLEARTGAWYPEGPQGKRLDVAAFAELGKPLQNPGPLIRVTVGTQVRTMVHNSLAEALTVYGLGAARGYRDSVVIAPGASQWVTFTATTPGTYYYAGKTGTKPIDARFLEDSQLNGAIVVDPATTASAARPENDRVFLLSWYFTLDPNSPTGLGHATMAINGLSWPHTERIDLTQGDSVQWHLVNLTQADHPMHLHGFYFRVDAKGDGVRDTVYAAADRHLAVTEIVLPMSTTTIAWAPQRAGNWIFHCHYSSHVSSLVSLDREGGSYDPHAPMAHPAPDHDMHAAGAPHQMFGLVLGIRVAPKPTMVASHGTRAERSVRVLVRQRANVYGDKPGYAFVFGGSADDASGALPIPARPLVLTKGEPVAITIVNRAMEPATIHWHGIELESYPDGVPGWSGEGQHVMPSIAPGDSLTVHFTPPRAGTFMYHSHFDEYQQINSGLYGPIIVLEPGQRFDPETDRVLFIGNGGPTTNVIRGPLAPLLLNGEEKPAPMELKAGTTYRFRVLNLSDDFPAIVLLNDGDHPTMWRAVAKDGADLPASQATMRPAVMVSDPGEIYDFAFTPQKPGDLTLVFGHIDIPGSPKMPKVPVVVHVR
ncbi:multicopper oxidase type 3 [Gemmatirosa kalamazoonensis]|uniref:Multicopper oxidase type 3 n=1 Tax=Gemmatirosa kalamazoonensis TaxID=861299 RepID=W0RND7_9BACT|nr:multicopper oxidase domain-containing protein [Gemmatirosa kalamazoonensis]AHG91835.1 multicopper oxidase type 3 [Gemmatirosa kalamazoonensis]